MTEVVYIRNQKIIFINIVVNIKKSQYGQDGI